MKLKIINKLKDLTEAHSLAGITDFIDIEYIEDYKNNSELSEEEIIRLCNKYQGSGISSLSEYIIGTLKDNL